VVTFTPLNERLPDSQFFGQVALLRSCSHHPGTSALSHKLGLGWASWRRPKQSQWVICSAEQGVLQLTSHPSTDVPTQTQREWAYILLL